MAERATVISWRACMAFMSQLMDTRPDVSIDGCASRAGCIFEPYD